MSKDIDRLLAERDKLDREIAKARAKAKVKAKTKTSLVTLAKEKEREAKAKEQAKARLAKAKEQEKVRLAKAKEQAKAHPVMEKKRTANREVTDLLIEREKACYEKEKQLNQLLSESISEEDKAQIEKLCENLKQYATNLNEINGDLQKRKICVLEIGKGTKEIKRNEFLFNNKIDIVKFPDSLEEVRDDAFSGCTSLRALQINNCKIKKIGAGAFYDTALKFVELPVSIEYLAPDAFPPKCFVAIDGEMPEYVQKLKELELKQDEINNEKEKLKVLNLEAQKAGEKIIKHNAAQPYERSMIPQLQKDKDVLTKRLRAVKKDKAEKEGTLKAEYQESERRIESLITERKMCSIFALSRKKELELQIADEIEKETETENKIDRANSEYSAIIDDIKNQLDQVEGDLMKFSPKCEEWEKEERSLKNVSSALEKQIRTGIEVINKLEKSYFSEKERIFEARQRWTEKYHKAKIAFEEEIKKASEDAKIYALLREKAEIIVNLDFPEENIGPFSYVSNSRLIEDRLISQNYQRKIQNDRRREYVALFNDSLKSQSRRIKKLREINALLNKPEYHPWIELQKIKEPSRISFVLPEKFLKLNTADPDDEEWTKLRQSAKPFASRKRTDADHIDYFQGLEYIRFRTEDEDILLFPYYIIAYKDEIQMRVYDYQQIKVSVKSIETDQTDKTNLKNGEFIGEDYLHVNADGTPSKRYKDNPLVRKYRFTKVVFSCGRKKIASIPVKSLEVANAFLTEYRSYADYLFKGKKKEIYKDILASKDLDTIKVKIDEFEAAKKEEALCRKKKAEEERNKLREERLVAKKAAEAEKLEIIQRQKELNEERKRQRIQQREKEKQIARLFEDDFSDNPDLRKTAEIITEDVKNDYPNLPVEIIGNRTISNTVFKINLNTTKKIPDCTIIAYITDAMGNAISNKKKIIPDTLGGKIELGFVLQSGIDYTTMNSCTLQFEQEDEIIGRINLNMKIAFSPEDF